MPSLVALGATFAPITDLVKKTIATKTVSEDITADLYRVTIPEGTQLAHFKDKPGLLGTYLDGKTNKIAGQAVLEPVDLSHSVALEHPVILDPTLLVMAAVLMSIDKKLTDIREIQQEMMDFLVKKEKAELRGDLIFLSDIMDNYKFNWNNEMFKNSNHVKVLDIRQASEQKILFYRDRILSALKKKTFFHSDKDVKKQIEAVGSAFGEYQLALYVYAFSSFLDVMLMGNFASDFINAIKEKIKDYSRQYLELYTNGYGQLVSYSDSSLQSTLLKGIKVVSKATGEKLSKVPVLSKGSVDETLTETGEKLERFEYQRILGQLQSLSGNRVSCVRPFLENLEAVERFGNNPLCMVFDKEAVYIGTEG